MMPLFGMSSFRLMQAHSAFPFLRFFREISWVQRHALVNPPVHGVQVDLQDKNDIKQVDKLGEIPRAAAKKVTGSGWLAT